ncbi:MAG: alpha/beta hydrolase, partial [bacterium]|nr:alpha/beta hydrolase [bacterium]
IDPIEDQLKSFFLKPIEFSEIKNKVRGQIVAIHSDNDPYVDLKHADVFKNKLDAKVIVKHNMGHFSEPDGDGDDVVVKELPVVIEVIKNQLAY